MLLLLWMVWQCLIDIQCSQQSTQVCMLDRSDSTLNTFWRKTMLQWPKPLFVLILSSCLTKQSVMQGHILDWTIICVCEDTEKEVYLFKSTTLVSELSLAGIKEANIHSSLNRLQGFSSIAKKISHHMGSVYKLEGVGATPSGLQGYRTRCFNTSLTCQTHWRL